MRNKVIEQIDEIMKNEGNKIIKSKIDSITTALVPTQIDSFFRFL